MYPKFCSFNGQGNNMTNIGKLDMDRVLEIAQSMGYDPKKPEELNEYLGKISKMDLWDISRILFFRR
jgi:hypothetical protein